MKRPGQLPGVHVPRAHVARGPLRREFLRGASRNDEALEHDGRRTQPVAARQVMQDLGSIQIDDAVVAKSVVGLAGLCVQRIQLAFARTENDLRGGLRVAGPIFHAARGGGAGGELKGPDFFPGGRIHGHHPGIRRRHVHRSIDDERSVFARGEARPTASSTTANLGRLRRVAHRAASASTVPDSGGATTPAGWRDGAGRPHMIHPRHLEPIDIRRLDFRQR